MKHLSLIKKAKKGNKEAFADLLIIHSEQLYRTAFLYAGNREDALDIVQETSFKAFQAVGQLKNPHYFLTWLIKILINSAYDLKRKQGNIIPLDVVGELSSDLQGSYVDYIDLADAIRSLRSTYRDAVILFYFHDFPIKEIASVMEVPENTVKTYLQRGKKELKSRLEGVGKHGQRKVSTNI
ncbi:sigma-70 family RNA polymerase sigma factor [Bacillus spongiae]|uniref:Sigma-70 family RNA polymerase sigma factor n=1 Tax=Bacillus spongiae TaxID=2683610 RepID=A0ABU8HK19_9BACI